MDGNGERSTKSPSSSSYRGVFIPTQWEETADSIAYDSSIWPPPITLVCGPGNSGKSTFSRLLLNTLLKRYKRVGYLDTDVGQPEFTAPGCVSLHIVDEQTPDLTILYLKTPEKFFFFGDVCAKRNPEAHLNYIFSVYDYFLSEYHQFRQPDTPGKPILPLIINTSGWVKGIGYDMLVEMLRYTSPTHVVQIRTSPESKNLPSEMFWLDGKEKAPVNLIEISGNSSIRSGSTKKDPHIIRDLRFIAYFRQCLPRDFNISTYNELAHGLASISPIEIPFSGIKVMHLQDQVSSSKMYHSLDDTIVGLAVSSSVPPSSKCRIPWCVGLGIIRAVDFSRHRLYVVTPVPCCQLGEVDILLQGSIVLPSLLQVHSIVANLGTLLSKVYTVKFIF